MERLIYANDDAEIRQQQGVAQALVAILGLPERLEEDLVAEAFRSAHSAVRDSTREGLDTPRGVEEY